MIDLESTFENQIGFFKRNVLPLESRERGILTSEGFAFCALAKALRVDVIIESGVWLGRSTEIWARFFQGKIPIIAVDRKISNEARRCLEPYQINLITGDSTKVLLDIVTQHKGRRIAVFIDGPKGLKALKLLKSVYGSEKVMLAAMHDVHKLSFGKANKTRKALEAWEGLSFCTDTEWFVKRYSFLDKNDSVWDLKQNIKWVPYELLTKDSSERKLGSYGPTIGFAIKEK